MASVISSQSSFDWQKCIFCQKDIPRSRLVCPADSSRPDVGSGYKKLSDMVEGFKAVDKMPPGIKTDCWDDGTGIELTLSKHRASWHQQCRTVLHSTTLERLLKSTSREAEKTDASPEADTDVQCSEPATERISTRSVTGSKSTDFTPCCFFCGKEGVDKDKLRQVLTDKLNNRVKRCAKILNDIMIIAKLTSGHMSSRGHKYHASCLLAFYYKASRAEIQAEMSVSLNDDYSELNSNVAVDIESIALSEILAYTEEVRSTKGETPAVFTLAKLCDLYQKQIKCHGGKMPEKIHATRFKERLLLNFPDLVAITQGRDDLLAFDDDLGNTLKTIKDNHDADAVHLMHTAKLIRGEIFANCHEFDGTFPKQCQHNAVPKTLITFITMLLEGAGNFDAVTNQAALSISQLIVFNAVKRRRRSTATDVHQRSPIVRHPVSQETPLPIYIGMMLHSATRKAKLVNKCHRLGLSISYPRVIQLSNKLANTVCDQYKAANVVCPPALRGELFSVAAVDNIDHNLSSATATSSFHGTAISIFQFPTADNDGIDRSVSYSLSSASDSVSSIAAPTVYSEVPPCIMPSGAPTIPKVERVLTCSNNILVQEFEWLNNVVACIDESPTDVPVDLTWASFHASRSLPAATLKKPIMSMLPLFRHSANTVAMIRHSLTVVASAVALVNPGQVPVITFDQPLFALAKQIQWHWPQEFGENRFVIMMGGLHIEMAALRMLGHWLESSGWVHCLVQANVATAGIAEAFIHASHVKRSRYAHTVTAAALFGCIQRSYAQFCADLSTSDSKVTLEQWCCLREKDSILFKYWYTVLRLQLLALTFVRSIRERNFELYVETLQSLAPWFFSVDQTNYARWLSVHLRDMLNLKHSHPGIAKEFQSGNFTVAKSNRCFSAISVDQAHEQLNALIKGDGGAIGITESESALTRWVVAGPEILRILTEFEGVDDSSSAAGEHHEQKPADQRRFKEDVLNMLQVFDELGNPFSDTSNELVALDTNIVTSDDVCKSVRTAEEIGVEQMSTFFYQRLHGPVSVLAPLRRNKLLLFTNKSRSIKTCSKRTKVSELKSDCELFSRLYISCQSRDGNLDEFFAHENQPYPPSLSLGGSLRFGTKAYLLTCLLPDRSDSPEIVELSKLSVDAYLFDGAVIAQMIRPGCCVTFEDYGSKMVWPYIKSFASKVRRLDIVFDSYVDNSLKAAAREKRGTGVRTRVTGATKIPKNWQGFLRVDSNKTELFHFLSDLLIAEAKVSSHSHTQLLITYDNQVHCNTQTDVSTIDPCSHEEADTRLILHCLHAAANGFHKVAIRTVDTDVVVLAIAFFAQLQLLELWIHFGVGKNSRLIAVRNIANKLGIEKCRALPVFHALTGCDTTSAFSHKGKKSAWEAWNCYPTVTEAFLNLYSSVDDIDDATYAVLERFVIVMYDRTTECLNLNSLRKQLFTRKTCALEMLPPTSNSFMQHVRRSVYQAVFVWGQCLIQQPKVFDPCSWGWSNDGQGIVPLWMTIPEVVLALSELIRCGCLKGCLSRCKCVRANLACTALCKCDGECAR